MLPNWIDKYIGLPFDEYNCWQLMCLVYEKEFLINLPTFSHEYKHAGDRKPIEKIYLRELQERFSKIDAPKKYRFIVLRMNGQPWHCGLIVSDRQMLHTDPHTDAVIEDFTTKIWKNRVIGYYEYTG